MVPCQRQLLWKRRILMVKQMRACTKLFNNLGERITKQKEGCVLKWPLGGNWSKPDSWANLKSCSPCVQGWMVGTICGVNSYFMRRGRNWRIQAGAAVISWVDGADKPSLINTLSIILYLLLVLNIPSLWQISSICHVQFLLTLRMSVE